MVIVGAKIFSAVYPLSSSSSSQWQCGGACLSRVSAVSSRASRTLSPLFLARASSSHSKTTPPSSDSSSNLLPPRENMQSMRKCGSSLYGLPRCNCHASRQLPHGSQPCFSACNCLVSVGATLICHSKIDFGKKADFTKNYIRGER